MTPTSLNKRETFGICVALDERLLPNNNKGRQPLASIVSIFEISHLVTNMGSLEQVRLMQPSGYMPLLLPPTLGEGVFLTRRHHSSHSCSINHQMVSIKKFTTGNTLDRFQIKYNARVGLLAHTGSYRSAARLPTPMAF